MLRSSLRAANRPRVKFEPGLFPKRWPGWQADCLKSCARGTTVKRFRLHRRHFIALFGVGLSPLPLQAKSANTTEFRRVGLLIGYASGDVAEAEAIISSFVRGLGELHWKDGVNLQVAALSAVGSPDNIGEYADELNGLARSLVARRPDVIFTDGTVATAAVLSATRTIPVVFINVSDPIASGFVSTLERPDGNATGFVTFGYQIAGKWLRLLKEIAPDLTRVAAILDRTTQVGIGQWEAIQATAPLLEMDVIPAEFNGDAELERAVAAFARTGSGGLIVTTSAISTVHREDIIALAARYKLPAIYPRALFVVEGGLISYGPVQNDQIELATTYVDRLLKGASVADLSVMTAARSELAINLVTAKALGINPPPNLLEHAQKLIP